MSLAVSPVVTVVRLRLQPAVRQLNAVIAMISHTLMLLEDFMVYSWAVGRAEVMSLPARLASVL
ncbi:hypothetical protein [Caballeronia sp. INDeC2]|uniref:hypothetical protein n=1 Tax=Caballeronia sp. INDeC2 TaxID=2921747 RepID=UPI0020291F5B|nr:hypothetical protein [Caballeronia sp. INDeC2]